MERLIFLQIIAKHEQYYDNWLGVNWSIDIGGSSKQKCSRKG